MTPAPSAGLKWRDSCRFVHVKILSSVWKYQRARDRILLSTGCSLFIGPGETRVVTLPCQVDGQGIRGIVCSFQRKGILSSVVLTQNGLIRVQFYNSVNDVVTISPKAWVCSLLIFADCWVEFDKQCDSTPSCFHVDEYAERFPSLFGMQDDAVDRRDRRKALDVGYEEVQWKVKEIPLANQGIVYNVDFLKKHRLEAKLAEPERRGQIRKLLPHEHARMSPIMFKEKSDGRLRPLNDYRELNAFSDAWTTYFPGTISVIRSIPSTWRYFSCIDLLDGFQQIGVDDKLARRFGFEVLGQRWCWKTLPQGWASSSGLFHSRVLSITQGLPVVCYIDDLLVGGSNKEEHEANLLKVLEVLEIWGLLVNKTKMQVAKEDVEFLGMTLKEGTFSFKRYLERVSRCLPQVSDKKSLRKVIGMAGFTRPACPHLSKILEPVQRLLKLQKLPPREEMQEIVDRMWMQVVSGNLEVYRNQGAQERTDWNLYCDWSDGGQGYALFMGKQPEGRMVALNSRREVSGWKTSSFLGELKTIVWALKDVEHLLQGDRVTVWTDSESSQKRLMSCRLDDFSDKRVSRCLGYLLENFPIGARLKVKFLPSGDNSFADQLSRWDVSSVSQVGHITSEQEQQIEKAHRGHWNARKTNWHLKREGIHFKGMWKAVKDFVQRCPECQFHSGKRYHSLYHGRESKQFNDVMAAEFAGPYKLPYGKHPRYLLILVDALTRYTQIDVTKSCDSSVVVRALQRWCLRDGKMRCLQTDNGSAFVASSTRTWLQNRGIDHVLTPVYTPSSNGLVERCVGAVKLRIKKMLMQENGSWTSLVPEVEKQINSAVHETTLFTPDELRNGQKRSGERVSFEQLEAWRKQAVENTTKARSSANRRFARKNKIHDKLHVGDRVLMRIPQRMRKEEPFMTNWMGPLMIKQKTSGQLWVVEDSRASQFSNVHTLDLKRFFSDHRRS